MRDDVVHHVRHVGRPDGSDRGTAEQLAGADQEALQVGLGVRQLPRIGCVRDERLDLSFDLLHAGHRGVEPRGPFQFGLHRRDTHHVRAVGVEPESFEQHRLFVPEFLHLALVALRAETTVTPVEREDLVAHLLEATDVGPIEDACPHRLLGRCSIDGCVGESLFSLVATQVGGRGATPEVPEAAHRRVDLQSELRSHRIRFDRCAQQIPESAASGVHTSQIDRDDRVDLVGPTASGCGQILTVADPSGAILFPPGTQRRTSRLERVDLPHTHLECSAGDGVQTGPHLVHAATELGAL